MEDDIFQNIFQYLQDNKFEGIKNNYLLDMITFDNIKERKYGDTLLHYFFRHYKELLPVPTLKFLISCFFRVDHYNNDNKTAVHILLEKHSEEYEHFDCFIKSGISLFQKKGDALSIFEYLIFTDNLFIFQRLIVNLKLEYIRKFYYDKSLSLSIKYESKLILKLLISNSPINLYALFQEFLKQIHVPTNDDDEESANYQFFLAIKNSKKKIFQQIFEIFENYPNSKFITLDMLYYCTDTSFCIYLSKYIKDGEYSKISLKNDQIISNTIFTLVSDINSQVYGSRTIIHKAVLNDKIDIIRKIHPIMYDSLDYSGNTPLYYAIKKEKYEIAKYLLKYGDCDFCHLGKRTTPLHMAVKGRLKILEKMLSYVNKKKYKHKFDINVKDRNQNTPLLAPFFLESSKSNDKKNINHLCLRLIIENGADITTCDSKGNNILYYAFKFYHVINSNDFVKFILNKKNLTITENGEKTLLIQLYNNQDQDLINLFHDKFEINADFMKVVFSKCINSNIEKAYSLLKKQGKENDYFFECLKKANDKTFNSMLETIKGLCFYIDENDNNNNVLFILANSYFNSEKNLIQIIITIFKLIIENNKDEFFLIQNKENGDNFFHIAIRRRNNLLIKIMLDIYQKKENNQIIQCFLNDKNRILSLINRLFNQKNNDIKNSLTSIELGSFLISDFRKIFPLEIFEKEPSYNELENFLNKYSNPNIIQNNEPLIIKYVKYEKFTEIEMLKILELFNSYNCDFLQNQDEEYAALILFKRYYFKALDFLLSNRGVGFCAAKIMDIILDSKNAFKIMKLYKEATQNIENKTIFEIIENNENEEIIKNYIINTIEDKNLLFSITNIIDDIKKRKEKIIFIDMDKIDKKVTDEIIKFSKYYEAFISLGKFIVNSNAILEKVYQSILNNTEYDGNCEKFWSILPIIQRFSTFNIHYQLIIDSFKKCLIYESPIQNFFEIFLPFLDEFYTPFYIKILSIQNEYTTEQIDQFMKDSKSLIGNFMTITNFFSAYDSNIKDLIKYNLSDSMKEQLLIPKEKCHEMIDKIQVFSPYVEEFKSVIHNKKIVYDIDFDISQLSQKFYQVFVNIIDYNIEYFTPEMKLKEFYLICSDEVILLASINSEEVHFLFKQNTSDVFCETSFNYIESKLKLFTFDGMVEFKQIGLGTNDKNIKVLQNIGQLMIKKQISKLNESFKVDWNSQKSSNAVDSNDNIMVILRHVDKTMHIICYHFKFNRNAYVNEVKEFGKEQIEQNIYKNDINLMKFSLEDF